MKTEHTMGKTVGQNISKITATIVAGAMFAGCLAMNAKPLMDEVGIQLYSVRKQLQKDVPGTLDEVRGWGIKYVELAGDYGLGPEKFKAELDEHHLVPISGHFGFEQWEKDPDAVLREAKTLGLKYVGCAWIPHKGDFDEATCRHAIEVFNRAGELAAEQHMQFFYHTHGYEFQPHGDGTLFDFLVENTDRKNVKFEMDIFWVAHAGQDPVKLLAKYPKRFVLMHLKDMKNGTKTGLLTGSSDVNNDVTLGVGQLDIAAIIHEARRIGVKYYFIEDESDTSEKQIPESLRYLQDLK
ncbi:MAG TPA: sugar phosphate isomerase/epimerase [Verrucomicrobiae bacterium]